MGGRRFSAARLFCGHTGRRWAVRRIYRPLRENRPACRRGVFGRFFARRTRFRGADHAPSGGGRSMPRAVLATDAVLLQGVPQRLPDRMPVRGMGARAFSPAGLCAMIPPGGYGDAGRGLYKEAATLPFRNVAAVWALRPVVRLSLSVRSRRCSAGRCCVRRRRRHSNCRSVPLWPPRRRAGSQRSRSPSAVRSHRPKPRSSSSCPSTAGARTRCRPPLPT